MNHTHLIRVWILLTAGGLLAGCAGFPGWQPDVSLSEQELQKSLKHERTANREMDEKLALTRLQLLEQDAQKAELGRKLDEATLEVVRTKAMLQSLESKAEAASTLAEGEIALKAIKTKVGATSPAGLDQAEALLYKSNQELKKENYGGALYLAAQAKSLIKEDQDRLQIRQNIVLLAGEVTFDIPIPLRANDQANVRKEPDLEAPILFVLQEGDKLVGYSYRGVWVHIATDDGRRGWIHYSLIAGRSNKP
ncbi:MAG TPA: SH3 domain-containing protein [Nitrospiria bacterium]|nr:SH3 domain-containing protein [Nitrospiria bacterium]